VDPTPSFGIGRAAALADDWASLPQSAICERPLNFTSDALVWTVGVAQRVAATVVVRFVAAIAQPSSVFLGP
jgi:hypothetical protein